MYIFEEFGTNLGLVVMYNLCIIFFKTGCCCVYNYALLNMCQVSCSIMLRMCMPIARQATRLNVHITCYTITQ